MKKLIPLLLAILLVFGMTLPAAAAETDEAPYTYTVRIFAGAQGTINGQEVLVFSNLAPNTRVNFDLDSVGLTNGDKYYVKGIRESGRDNNTVSTPSILVSGDVDYVVAYGLLGSSVAYTVRYVDEEGNELAPADTYYGNVGDKPVVSYAYIEGYQPQAYNLTRTLSENAADNVFTFTYTRVETGEGEEQPGGAPGEGEPAAPGEEGEPGAEGEGEGEGAGGEGAGGEGATVIPPEETPAGGGEENGPAQLIDEDETPLGKGPLDSIVEVFSDAAALPLWVKLLVSGGALMLMLLLAWLLLIHRRKKKEENA